MTKTCPHCHATVLSTSQPNLMGTTTDIAQELAQQIPDNNDMITMQMHVSKRAAVLAALAATPAVGGEGLADRLDIHAGWAERDHNLGLEEDLIEAAAALRAPPASPLRGRETSPIDRCICQDQHRRGYCTEPGCPYALASSPEQPAAVKMYRDALAAANARIADLEYRLSKAAFATLPQRQVRTGP